ncbi:MAG: hypothetical protein GX896_02665 [Clostridiales bacterium]|nr:hypothetical protein [Clostridiales bacterium]
MIKYCKSCGKEYSGDYCDHCGYGNPNLKIKSYEKYKTVKPERFLTDEEKSSLIEQKESEAKISSVKALERKEKNVSANAHTNSSAKPIKRTSGVGFLALVFCVFAIITFIVLFQSGKIFKTPSKDQVIKTYFLSIASADFKEYTGTMIKPMAKENESDMEGANLSEEAFMKELYSDYTDGFGEGYTISIEINSYKLMSVQDISTSEETLNEAYNKTYNIKEAFEANVDVSYKGTKAQETVNYVVYIAKIGRNWYILNII